MQKDTVSKSWFCVFNNPKAHGYEGDAAEISERIKDEWISGNPQRTCAIAYCISEDGLEHVHAVFEDVTAMRFSKIKKIYPSMHIQETKGNKDQAEDYINKRGQFAEHGEQIIYTTRHGEIKGKQGQRRDLEIIEEMINNGKTPNEIFDMNISYRKHFENVVNKTYFRKRYKETPFLRKVQVTWHWGASGTGKSYTAQKLHEEHGEDKIHFVSEYKHGFDNYNGQEILFLDEFRGNKQLSYSSMLSYLHGYKVEIDARYSNKYALWTEVHITSVYPPEELYDYMIQDNKMIDTYEQIRRRINTVEYHYRDENGNYASIKTPMEEYTGHQDQKNSVTQETDDNDAMPWEIPPPTTLTQGKL
jgi:hypothetical protein